LPCIVLGDMHKTAFQISPKFFIILKYVTYLSEQKQSL
jgi:hypothetical protein